LPVSIAVENLRKLCDPYEEQPWRSGGSLTRELVAECIQAGNLSNVVTQEGSLPPKNLTIEQHAARVAWFVVHGWSDDIHVDVGVPSLGCVVSWPVVDGNHRLAAAIYRDDEHISADVSGQVSYAFDLLGVNI
jgi:hypothetical protein